MQPGQVLSGRTWPGSRGRGRPSAGLSGLLVYGRDHTQPWQWAHGGASAQSLCSHSFLLFFIPRVRSLMELIF